MPRVPCSSPARRSMRLASTITTCTSRARSCLARFPWPAISLRVGSVPHSNDVCKSSHVHRPTHKPFDRHTQRSDVCLSTQFDSTDLRRPITLVALVVLKRIAQDVSPVAWLWYPVCAAASAGRYAICTVGDTMLEQLRGRNLAHVGCTMGLVLGLIAGMFAAILVISIYQATSAADWATFAFFTLTFGLGALGYYLGTRLTRRLWGSSEPREYYALTQAGPVPSRACRPLCVFAMPYRSIGAPTQPRRYEIRRIAKPCAPSLRT